MAAPDQGSLPEGGDPPPNVALEDPLLIAAREGLRKTVLAYQKKPAPSQTGADAIACTAVLLSHLPAGLQEPFTQAAAMLPCAASCSARAPGSLSYPGTGTASPASRLPSCRCRPSGAQASDRGKNAA